MLVAAAESCMKQTRAWISPSIIFFFLFFLEAEMKGCSVLTLFPQWQTQWEHLATHSPWSCSSSSSKFCHLKEVLRSAQHSRHIRLSACLTCTHLESVRTHICSRKFRACPLIQAPLRNRFCRCTLKWSVFPSHGLWGSFSLLSRRLDPP